MFANPTSQSTQVINICKLSLYSFNLHKGCVGDSLSLNALVCAGTCMHLYAFLRIHAIILGQLVELSRQLSSIVAWLQVWHSLKSDDCSPMHAFSKR